MTVSYKFGKEERLSSKKAISDLFDRGQAFTVYPFRIFWKISEEEILSPAQMAVSVSKKSFKKAVDRNRIKRLTREAWRHKKHILYGHLERNNLQITLMLVYTQNTIPDYEKITHKVEEVVSKLLLILQPEDGARRKSQDTGQSV